MKCVNCLANADYEIIECEYTYEEKDIFIKYKGKKAICKNCGEEIIIDEIEDFNQNEFEKEYRKLNEIITNEEIKEILKKYDIGKRPLSLLLGLGEITITRYLNGYVPTKRNSILLKRILNDPRLYYSLLWENKDNITDLAFNKSNMAVLKLLNESGIEDNNLIEATNYIISKADVTPKALQKLLYYVQLFSLKFSTTQAFTSACKNWCHGPVFGKIYHKYKNFGFNIIDEKVNDIKLDLELKQICDAVIKYFGCYSGNILEAFTHSEKPWLNTKENEIIEKSLMKDFVFEICYKYNISSIDDIKKYSMEMFNNYMITLENN